MKAVSLVLLVMTLVAPAHAGNPLFDGWYADPEGIIIGDEYWIFPTYSAPYDQQLCFDAFSSKDLVTWTKHERILSNQNISWLRRALCVPRPTCSQLGAATTATAPTPLECRRSAAVPSGWGPSR